MIKKLGQVVLGIAIAGGSIYYKMGAKEETQAQLKTQMVELCAKEDSCLAAVNQYYDSCFEAHYQIKRRGSSFDQTQFLNCFNEKSGQQLFTMNAH
jgi:hypothetical protein